MPTHKHALSQYTLYSVPSSPAQSGLAVAHEGSQSSRPHSQLELVSARPWPGISGVTKLLHPHPGGFWPRVSSPGPAPGGQRRRATRAPLQPRPKRVSPHPSRVLHRVPPPGWQHSAKQAPGSAGVGMRSENRRGREAHGALGCAETPGGAGRRSGPSRLRRRGSGRAGPGPWHGASAASAAAAASRWLPPWVRAGWICRQPERFVLLHSCQAAGAVLQLRHPFGLLLVSLPAPRLALGRVRLLLGCPAAPQVRPWAAHGSGSAALRTLGVSPSCPPPCAAAAAAGPDPRSMAALITPGLGGSGG